MSAAKRRLRAAREALEANGRREDAAGITRETPEFRRLNREVIRAEAGVPWWRDDRAEIRDRFAHRREDRADQQAPGGNRKWIS